MAEASKAPLPPPPTSLDAPTAQDPSSDNESEVDTDMSNYSVDSDEFTATDTESYLSKSPPGSEKDGNEPSSPKKKPGRKIAGFLKRVARAGVDSALSVDRVQASLGSEHAKRRIGAVSDPPLTDIPESEVTTDPAEVEDVATDPTTTTSPTNSSTDESEKKPKKKLIKGPIENGEGPSVFSGRYHGKRGHILLINSPC